MNTNLRMTPALAFIQILIDGSISYRNLRDVEYVKDKIGICPLNESKNVYELLASFGFSNVEIRFMFCESMDEKCLGYFYKQIAAGKRIKQVYQTGTSLLNTMELNFA